MRRDLVKNLPVWASATFFFAVVVVLALRTYSVVNVPGQPDPQGWGLKDFRSNIYYPCRAAADGINPYNTDRYTDRYPVDHAFPLYSPLTLLIHQPLLIFPLEWAQWIYFGLTAVGSLLFARLMIQFVPFRFAHVLLLAGFLLASRPGYQNLTVGQTTLTAVLLTLLALRWAETRPWLSGLFLALATFKPTFGCLLFVLMVARRNFKATTCGLVLGCLLTLPVFGYLSYLEGGVAQFVDTIGESGDHFHANPGVDPTTSHGRLDAYLLLGKFSGVELDSGYEYLFALFMLAIAGACIFWKSGAARNEQCYGFSWSNCLLLLTMLVAIYHRTHDWLLVAFPLTVLIVGSLTAVGPVRPLARYSMIGLLLLPAVNYAASSTGSRFFDPYGLHWTLISSANSAALLAAWLISLYCLVRSPTLKERG